MRQHYLPEIFAIVLMSLLPVSCRDGADAFFSGRPSEMARLSNRVIAGPPETMVELLRVPSRFPEATEEQISHWQQSVIAWWRQPAKHELMIASSGKLSDSEMRMLRTWVRIRDKNQTTENARILDDMEAGLRALSLSATAHRSRAE